MAMKDFQVDPRVGIALDALTPSQKSALGPMLRDREGFVAHANRPGASKKLSASKPLYLMRAGSGMRIIYTVQDENIVVEDIMRQATMDRLATKRNKKSRPARKEHGASSAKRDEAAKVQKV